jgi:hypothetical protein
MKKERTPVTEDKEKQVDDFILSMEALDHRISLDQLDIQFQEVLLVLGKVSLILTDTWRDYLAAKRDLEKYEAEQYVLITTELKSSPQGKYVSNDEVKSRVRNTDKHGVLLLNMQEVQYRMNRLQAIKDFILVKKDILLGLAKQES